MQSLKDATHLSTEAAEAMQELLAGKICVPSESVVQELGRMGLAYRRDLRNFCNRRISLTLEGMRWCKEWQ